MDLAREYHLITEVALGPQIQIKKGVYTMGQKKLPDFTRSKLKQGDFNPDLSAGSVERREKTGQDFRGNFKDPGGQQQAFPTTSGGLASNNVHPSVNDNSLIKVFN